MTSGDDGSHAPIVPPPARACSNARSRNGVGWRMTAALTGCALQGSLWDVGEEAGLRELGGSVRRTVLSRRRLARPAAGVGDRLRRAVRAPGGDRPVARRAPADVRPGRRRPPPAQLLRRGGAAPPPAARPGARRRSARTTPPSSASRSSPPGCCSTATAATAWPGTATRIGRGRTEDTMVAIVSLGDPRRARAATARRWRVDLRSSWATATWW